ncbi:putative sulfotransferase [Magnetofaba australis IT-1]|uniref:Putative sulfotransferase n=2 Tax=Magnetofaba TaxID=1472292 RepID=A0A1Y2K0M8_9PROT|nr:putative sulfotransferase [Magnetofaba australis IT-1]
METPWRERAFDLYVAGDAPGALAAAQQAAHADDPYLLNLMALCHWRLGAAEQAVALWRQAADLKPDYAEPHFNLGVMLQEAGLGEAAETSYKAAIAAQPEHLNAHNNLGSLLERSGRAAEAEAFYRAAIRIQPDYAPAHANLGITLISLDRPEEAEACLREAVRLQPDTLTGVAPLLRFLRQQGRPAEAAEACRAAIAHQPQEARLYNTLGNLSQEMGDAREALAHYQRCLQLAPDFADAHFNLALLQERGGDEEAAIESYSRALNANTDHVAALSNLARLLTKHQRLEDADLIYTQLLRVRPDDVEALNNRGNVLCELQRHDQAEGLYRRVLELAPDRAATHANLGSALATLKRYAESEACYARALAIDPNCVLAWINQGALLMARKRFMEAEASLREALARNPLSPEAYSNLGNLLAATGREEEARAAFSQAILIKPDYAAAHRNRSVIIRFSEGDPNFSAIDSLLQRGGWGDGDWAHLHYAAGKAWSDIGEHGRAFDHFQQGAAHRRKTITYSADSTDVEMAAIAHFCDPQWIASRRSEPAPTDAPIFIVGMPRSGTTLVEQIVASHPDVHGCDELEFLSLAVTQRYQSDPRGVGRFLEGVTPQTVAQIGQQYLREVAGLNPTAPRFTDKMPGNFLYLGFIAAALPQARVIHVRRDPADTCVSCFTTYFGSGQSFSYDFSELARYYHAYARLMAHWRTALPAGMMLEVDYEALVAEPEANTRRMLEHCGLDWHPGCLDFHQNRRPIQTASVMQARQPLYASSVGRWKRHRAQLGPLLTALGPLGPSPDELG